MNKQFWDHLLVIATALEERAGTEDNQLPEVREKLESIGLVYHRAFDPADAYEEYVAVTLCRAIGQALSKPS